MFSKVTLLITGILLVACNQQMSINTLTSTKDTLAVKQYTGTTIDGVCATNNLPYLLENTSYSIQNSADQNLQTNTLHCQSNDNANFACNKINLAALPAGFYHLKINSGKGLIGATTLEINNTFIPNSLIVDEDTTGNYLISAILEQAKLNEAQLYQLLRQRLTGESQLDYDLATTLYDLFISYGGNSDEHQAINKLQELLQNGNNLPDKTNPAPQFLKPLF